MPRMKLSVPSPLGILWWAVSTVATISLFVKEILWWAVTVFLWWAVTVFLWWAVTVIFCWQLLFHLFVCRRNFAGAWNRTSEHHKVPDGPFPDELHPLVHPQGHHHLGDHHHGEHACQVVCHATLKHNSSFYCQACYKSKLVELITKVNLASLLQK